MKITLPGHHVRSFTLVLSTVLASLGHEPVAAMDISMRKSDVVTHNSQGDVKTIKGAKATMVQAEDGVFVDLSTRNLTPGHAYTMWFVAINAPHECSTSPCPGEEVLGASDLVRSDLGLVDGAIANADGSARFAGFQPIGALENAWFGNGFVDPRAEVHLVVRDHGPLQLGLERQMLTSFLAGCTNESIPPTLPETARADGFPGDYACVNKQVAIFPQ